MAPLGKRFFAVQARAASDPSRQLRRQDGLYKNKGPAESSTSQEKIPIGLSSAKVEHHDATS